MIMVYFVLRKSPFLLWLDASAICMVFIYFTPFNELHCLLGLEYADYIIYRGVRPTPKGVSWIYHKTVSDGEAPVLDIWGVLSTPSLLLLPDLLYLGVVLPVKVPFMGQIDLFKKLLILDRNTWCLITLNPLY